MSKQGFIKLIKSVDTHNASVIELNILPGEKTPWHYHSLFSETFEILSGTLEVGKGKSVLSLTTGDVATIEPDEHHYFHNTTHEECVIKVTIDPGNKNFERSLFIFKGLAHDGKASRAGTPKNLFDLALFVYLNNSRMVGIQKIAESLFNFIARRGIKSGRLERLVSKYTVATS